MSEAFAVTFMLCVYNMKVTAYQGLNGPLSTPITLLAECEYFWFSADVEEAVHSYLGLSGFCSQLVLMLL